MGGTMIAPLTAHVVKVWPIPRTIRLKLRNTKKVDSFMTMPFVFSGSLAPLSSGVFRLAEAWCHVFGSQAEWVRSHFHLLSHLVERLISIALIVCNPGRLICLDLVALLIMPESCTILLRMQEQDLS